MSQEYNSNGRIGACCYYGCCLAGHWRIIGGESLIGVYCCGETHCAEEELDEIT